MNRMKYSKKILGVFLAILTLLLTTPVGAVAEENPVQAEFYVDPANGSDANSGSKDAPFASLKKAVSRVKQETKNLKGDIYVWLADGRYELKEPLKFEQGSGGNKDYKVYYQAVDGATPVVSGGKEMKDWELHDSEKNIYKAKTGGIYSRHFVVDGAMALRARSEGGLSSVRMDYGDIGMTCSNIEMLDWKNKRDIEFVFYDKFLCKRILVDEIYRKNKDTIQIVLEEKFWDHPTSGKTYVEPDYIENAYELLDEEGEFYINRTDGYVYYKPLDGQDMEKIHAVIPTVEELFVVGGYDYFARTENIVFKGITFSGTTWMLPTTDRGYYAPQDGYIHRDMNSNFIRDWFLINPAAMTIDKAKNITVEECTFEALGASAVRILEGSEKINIVGNHMHDLGSGAIWVGNIRNTELNPKDTRKVVKDINVRSNYIHHVSKENSAAAAISAAYPYNLSITHNEICEVPYSGAHIGWGWSTVTEKTLKNFVFEYNYVHDFMKGKEMLDGGGIYTLGYTSATIENPNKIVRNYFKDCYSASVQAGGIIYLDNTSSHYLIEGNVLDNREGSKVWDGKAFAQSTYTPLNNFWRNNYSTSSVSHYTNNEARNVIFEGNHDHPMANWPKEAQDVIKKSGLEPKYRYLSPRSKEYSRVFTIEDILLNEDATYQLTPVATTEFCEEVSMDSATISYETQDESIATVSDDGLITAKTAGKTKVITNVTIGDITHTATTTVSVGAGLATVYISSGLPNKLVKGETKQLPTIKGKGYSGSDIEGELTNVTYKSSDENILHINLASGTLEAKNYGEVVLSYSGEFDGVTKEGEYKISVIDYADQAGLNYPTVTIEDLLKDTDDWYVKSGNILEVPNGWAFEQTSVAQYTKEMYQDEIFDFYMSLDKQATWPSITLRNQIMGDGMSEFNNFYILCFAKTGIELQRFNGNTRTSIFCDLLPNARIGKTHPMILEAGRKYHVQVGAINEENGVRIILNIDGVNVMNYLDETEGRVTEPGYFGLMINATTMNLTTK